MESLELLKHIEKVEAPPFLLTKIHQKIDNATGNRLSPRIVWSFAVSFLVVITFNIVVMTKTGGKNKTPDNLATSMNLIPDNSLYK